MQRIWWPVIFNMSLEKMMVMMVIVVVVRMSQ
jgi:hypothetical protein